MVYHYKNLLFIAMVALAPLGVKAQIPGSMSPPSQDLLLAEQNDEIEFTENPCPDPRQALSSTPNDLKIIQEDITRFTLCLQRAQLLNRLNELAAENIDTINSTIDAKLEKIAENFAPAPLPMPEIQIPDISQLSSENNKASDTQKSRPPEMATPPAPALQYKDWTIDAIKGKNGILIATLTDTNGNLVHVKQGDTIPETKIRVTSVTQINVRISEDRETAKLKWSQ